MAIHEAVVDSSAPIRTPRLWVHPSSTHPGPRFVYKGDRHRSRTGGKPQEMGRRIRIVRERGWRRRKAAHRILCGSNEDRQKRRGRIPDEGRKGRRDPWRYPVPGISIPQGVSLPILPDRSRGGEAISPGFALVPQGLGCDGCERNPNRTWRGGVSPSCERLLPRGCVGVCLPRCPDPNAGASGCLGVCLKVGLEVHVWERARDTERRDGTCPFASTTLPHDRMGDGGAAGRHAGGATRRDRTCNCGGNARNVEEGRRNVAEGRTDARTRTGTTHTATAIATRAETTARTQADTHAEKKRRQRRTPDDHPCPAARTRQLRIHSLHRPANRCTRIPKQRWIPLGQIPRSNAGLKPSR